MNELAALLTSLTQLQNIAKALLSLRDFEKLNTTVIELQNAIITAQQQTIAIQGSYTILEAKAHGLEAELVRLKDWSAEKQKYTCREVAKGVFAYVENGDVNDFGHVHKLCCKCFEDGQKSLLQQSNEPQRSIGLNCQRCKSKLVFFSYKNKSSEGSQSTAV